MSHSQATIKVGRLTTHWSAGPFGGTSSQIQTSVSVLRLPQIGLASKIQFLTNAREIAVSQAGAMSSMVIVVQSSSIALKLKSIGQLILGGKDIGIQAVFVVFKQIGMGTLGEDITDTRSVGFGQRNSMSIA